MLDKFDDFSVVLINLSCIHLGTFADILMQHLNLFILLIDCQNIGWLFDSSDIHLQFFYFILCPNRAWKLVLNFSILWGRLLFHKELLLLVFIINFPEFQRIQTPSESQSRHSIGTLRIYFYHIWSGFVIPNLIKVWLILFDDRKIGIGDSLCM